MAAGTILAKTGDIRKVASELGQYNDNLKNYLDQMYSTMKSMEGTYVSKDQETIFGAMESLKPRFQNFWNVVNSYKTFLENTANQYDNTEATADSNAKKFRN